MQGKRHSQHNHNQKPEDRTGQEQHEGRRGPRRFEEHGPERAGEHAREHVEEEPHGHHEGRHGGPHGHRNFWSEWRDERHHFGHGEDIPGGQALSPKEMEAWRAFFHQSFDTWPEEHWIFGGRRFSPWHQGMDTFNPFVATLLSKGGGLLPLYVLHLIAQQPRYGNEIMEMLAERTNGQWVSNPGAIYPLLTQLEKEGFIEGKWEDPDKRTIRVYTVTPAGQAEVSRIEMIVLPKLNETVAVLQAFVNDLQAGTAQNESTAVNETPDQSETEPQ